MLAAGREKVLFHGMPDRINTCLASESGQSQFRIGRDEENGAILEGERNTEVYCASHKNWIRNIRFSIINRPLSQ